MLSCIVINKIVSKKKFCLQLQRYVITSIGDLQGKIKYNPHIIKLIKIVKKCSNTVREKNKETVESTDLKLCFVYLYQNVIIQKANKEETIKQKQFNYEFVNKGVYNNNLSNNGFSNNAFSDNGLSNNTYSNDIFFNYNDKDDVFSEFISSLYKNCIARKYEEIVINKNAMNMRNLYKVYSIIQSNQSLSPTHLLLLLYNLFIFHTWNYEYLKKISTQILDNIYNFKTSEFILIQLFFVFFEKKENNSNTSIENLVKTVISCITKQHVTSICDCFISNELKEIETNHKNKIFPLVKDLTKYGNHLFYKRKYDLLLNEIKDLLFIYQSYDHYIGNKELLEYIIHTLEKNLKQIDIETLKCTLTNKNNQYDILKKFMLLLDSYYYLSRIESVTIDQHCFVTLCHFIFNHDLEQYCTIDQLIRILQIADRIENRKKIKVIISLLQLIDLKIKQMKQITETKVLNTRDTIKEKKKNQKDLPHIYSLENDILATKEIEKYIPMFHYIYELYEKSEYINEENEVFCTNGRRKRKRKKIKNNQMHVHVKWKWKHDNKYMVTYKNNLNEKVSNLPNDFNVHKNKSRIKQIEIINEGEYKNDIEYNNTNNIESNNTNNTKYNNTNNTGYNTESIIKYNTKCNTELCHSLTFFDDINMYMKPNLLSNRYIEILISVILRNETNCEKLLLHFINDIHKIQNINMLLLYVYLISHYFKNIYILFYLEYIYTYILKNKCKHFSAEKIILLLYSLYNLISYKTYLKDITKQLWEENSRNFLLLLYKNNLHVHTHMKNGICSLNQNNITNFDQLLFLLFFKNMINNTFSTLLHNLPYIHNKRILEKNLYYFLCIHYYSSCYQDSYYNNDSLIKKIAALFFQRIFHLHFLQIYKMKDESDNYELTKELLHFVYLDKDVDPTFINCIMRVYFQNSSNCWKRNEKNPFVNLEKVFQKLLQRDCHLKYENGFLIFEKQNNINHLQFHREDKQLMKNILFQKEQDLYAIHVLLLIQLEVPLNHLITNIKELLQSYVN